MAKEPDYGNLGEWAKRAQNENSLPKKLVDNFVETFPTIEEDDTEKAELIYHFGEITSALQSNDPRAVATAQEGLKAFFAPLLVTASEEHAVPGLDQIVQDATAIVNSSLGKGRG